MQKNSLINTYFLYFFFIIIFLLFTNTHFDYQDSLIFGGADGHSYMSISKDAPKFTFEKIMSIHSERFFFPYLIGLVSKILKINLFLTYKASVFLVLVIINIYTIKIFKSLKLDLNTTLVLLTLINFNPYLTRFYIAVPTIINDLIFIAGILIFLQVLLSKKLLSITILIGYIFIFASRQTSIGLILAYLTTFLIKGKKLISVKNETVGLIIFILFLILNFYYSSNTIENSSSRYELYSPQMRIFGLFIQDFPVNEKIIFLLLPLLSFSPLIFYFILFRKSKFSLKQIFESKFLVFLFSFITLVILQPILSGVEVTGRNILRLTSLAYIPLLIALILVTKKRKNNLINQKIFIIVTIIIATLHSFHPTFSKIQIFEFLKF